ncbi:hypothetical protein GCM10028791_00770 [Echinicola sediminis]
MGKKKQNKKKLKRSQKRLIRVFAITLFTLGILQVGLYFGSDLLLRNYVQRWVQESSEGRYEVNFDRFNLSIFERGFYFTGFILSPTDLATDTASQKPIYKVQAPEIAVKGIGYDFSNNVLRIGNISFVKPVVQTNQELDLSKGEDQQVQSRLEQFADELRNSLEDIDLKEIVIENLFVEQADLLIENFVSEKSVKAENTSLHLKEIFLLSPREKATPFNAAGFELDLENFEMLLADSVHTLKAVQIHISSLENFIQAKQVKLEPDLDKKQEVYYRMKVDDLELTDADINQVFYTKDVQVGSLKLLKPNFLVYSELSPERETNLQDYSLYPLIKDILSSISIDDLLIQEGEYLQRGVDDEYKNRIEADKIDFKMDRVYIGPDKERSRGQFFYAEDAELDMSKVKLVLADGVHWVTGERVLLSSFEDKVLVEGAKVAPFREVSEDINLFQIEVPSFSLEKANLKKVYNESILDIQEMVISNPSLKFENIQRKKKKKKYNTVKELTKDYLKAIYVDRLQLIDGEMVLSNNLEINKDSISFGSISLVLEDFAVDEGISRDTSSRVFLAEALELELNDYAMKLTDDLHLLTAGKVFVDTKAKALKIENLEFKPLQPGKIAENLERLNKKSVLEVNIPEFFIHGVDIPKAYFEGELLVESIEVPSPDIKLSRYISRDEGKQEVEIHDLYDLATSYFSRIKVDSLSLIKGAVAYDNYVRGQIKTFTENDVSIHVKNFTLDKEVAPRDAEPFFAEELDISLNNYVFNIANGKYNMRADRISYNSSEDELVTSNVRLSPNKKAGMKVAIGADVPLLNFKGVDIEAFLFENALSLEKVKLSDADVRLFIDKEEIGTEGGKSASQSKGRRLPKTIDVIRIDTVEAANARFTAYYSSLGEERELINSAVDLSFYGLLLDSAKLQKGDIVGFFDNMSMDIGDFSLALNDSVHTINFSKVELDTKSDKITLENFKVVPLGVKNNHGHPIIDAFVPAIHLKTNSLTSFQETGDFDVRELVLDQPEIKLYLDSKEEAENGKKARKKLDQDVIRHLGITDFILKNGQLSIYKKDSVSRAQQFKGLNIALSDLNFDFTKAQVFDTDVVLNQEFEIELPEYSLKLPDSLNVLEIGKVMLSNGCMVLKDVQLKPRYGNYEYVHKMNYQTDVIHAELPEVRFDGIDVQRLVNSDEVEARSMSIKSPKVHVFRDKRMPFDSSLYRPMPQKLMRSSGLKMELDTLKLWDGTVTYEEFPQNGMVPGHITFDSLNATITPLYLSKSMDASYSVDSSKLKASAKINGQAPLDMMAMLYFEPPYAMKVSVTTGEYDFRTINSILARNAFVKVKRGRALPSQWAFVADENEAIGDMTFRYDGLKVQLLNERTLKKAGGRKGMLNFVLNTFALRSNNPRGLFKQLKSSPIYYKRDTTRFIFNYWWKLSLSGIKGNLGLGHPKKEEEEE